MGLWSIITGANKVGAVVDAGLDVVKTGMKGIDAMVFTDEEKSQAHAERVARGMAHVVELAKLQQSESGASAITRRVLGYIVMGNFTAYAIAALVSACRSRMDIVDNIIKTAMAISLGEMSITVIVATFGYYGITGAAKTLKK
jgi:hypothetical protein